jgi:hypothetical protein
VSALSAPAPRSLPLDAPCLVVFGMSEAGKTSLLGALARASEIQERGLGFRLADVHHDLAALRRHVYDGGPLDAPGPVTPHAVRVEPFLSQQAHGAAAFDLVLLDCDGRAAGELLADAKPIARHLPGDLAGQLLRADGVLLLLDAAAPPEQVERELSEFVRFLKRFRGARGERTDVSSLPVTLVLTKCDLLARAGDTQAVWVERVEARKDDAAGRFAEVIAEHRRTAFGTLAFDTAAVSLGLPDLANAPARPAEPFGVAPLFGAAIRSAKAYHQRRGHSELRVNRVMTGAAAAAAALFVFIAALVGGRTLWRPSPLTAAVRLVKDREGPPPVGHLAEPLGPRIDALAEIAKNEEFHRLGARDRAFVAGRLQELGAYQAFREQVRNVRPPEDVRDLAELQRIDRQLRDDVAAPADYAEAWAASDAVRQRGRLAATATALLAAVKQVTDTYADQARAFDRLFVLADFGGGARAAAWPAWNAAVGQAIAASDAFPIRAGERLAELPADAPAVNYSVPLAFTEADAARARWLTARTRLETLRDVVTALALVGGPGPTLRPAESLRVDQVPSWVAELRLRYPRMSAWSAADVSDAAAPAVREAALAHYRALLPLGRSAVAAAYRRAGDDPETPSGWRAAAAEAAARPALQAWNDVARVLLRLAGDGNADPVAELSAFLSRDTFSLDIAAVRITIPDALGPGRLVPQDVFRLTVQDAQARVNRRVLRPRGEPERDEQRGLTTYTLTSDMPTVLDYRPGETIWAELALRDPAGRDWQLSWWGGANRSRLYQFDRLGRAPLLHRLDERAEAGLAASGVRVEFVPPNGVPRLPDLFPEVK